MEGQKRKRNSVREAKSTSTEADAASSDECRGEAKRRRTIHRQSEPPTLDQFYYTVTAFSEHKASLNDPKPPKPGVHKSDAGSLTSDRNIRGCVWLPRVSETLNGTIVGMDECMNYGWIN
jgi:hypothetical protein